MSNRSDIQEKAMLITLHISQWFARKYDKKISKEVAERYETSEDSGRYNKVLIARDEIKKIQAIGTQIRLFHYEQTLPWGDSGERILPNKNYLYYTRKLGEYKDQFDTAVGEFCRNYPALVEEARIRLNGMFDPKDYPDPSRIHRKYKVETVINPIPDGQDFRVDLQAEEVSRIQTEIERRVQDSVNRAHQDLWRRLYDTVSHMADKLSDTDAIFRNTLVGNLVDLCELLPRLKLIDDPNMDKIKQEIEEKLCSRNPNILREDSKERKATAEAARGILDAIDNNGVLGDYPKEQREAEKERKESRKTAQEVATQEVMDAVAIDRSIQDQGIQGQSTQDQTSGEGETGGTEDATGIQDAQSILDVMAGYIG